MSYNMPVESFPDEVKQCIKEFRVVYDKMYKFRLVLRACTYNS